VLRPTGYFRRFIGVVTVVYYPVIIENDCARDQIVYNS
jgi:hypothetical protein